MTWLSYFLSSFMLSLLYPSFSSVEISFLTIFSSFTFSISTAMGSRNCVPRVNVGPHSSTHLFSLFLYSVQCWIVCARHSLLSYVWPGIIFLSSRFWDFFLLFFPFKIRNLESILESYEFILKALGFYHSWDTFSLPFQNSLHLVSQVPLVFLSFKRLYDPGFIDK